MMVAPLQDKLNVQLTPAQKQVLFRDYMETRTHLWEKMTLLFLDNWKEVACDLSTVPGFENKITSKFINAVEAKKPPERVEHFFKEIGKFDNLTVYLTCLACYRAAGQWSCDRARELSKIDSAEIPPTVASGTIAGLAQKADLIAENNRLKQEIAKLKECLASQEQLVQQLLASKI